MTPLSKLRSHRVVRYATAGLTIAIAILGAGVVSTLTIDLGPLTRTRAEQLLAAQLERSVQIGSLKVRLLFGRLEVEDLTIAGWHYGDRPFFTAKRVSAALDWSTAIARRPEFTITSVELTDWQMLVEKWVDGDNFPKLGSGSRSSSDSPVTATLRSFHGTRGKFSYEDHEAPWSIVAPNIELTVTKRAKYEGTVSFAGGTITIQDFVPMWANLRGRFVIEGGKVRLSTIELDSDGARTTAAGEVDVGHWPEMTFSVKSRLAFERMREIFFADEAWRLSGDAAFDGTFYLFKGGHDLSGAFRSALAGVNAYRFPELYGSLHWTRTLFEVWDAGSGFYGGLARYAFSISPLGDPEERPTHRVEASYDGVDLAEFSDFQQLEGLRFAGAASGRNLLEWPSGRFSDHRGEGHIAVRPPADVHALPASLTSAASDAAAHPRDEWGPFGPAALPRYLPIEGAVSYRFGSDIVELDGGRFATERTHVSFHGSTEWGERSQIPFHVTSADWQESQQVLAGILTDFGSPSDPVPFGGRGEFDGAMTGTFGRPRIEGVFRGEDMRAWDTVWGDGQADLAFENNYLTVRNASVRVDDSDIRADGLFAIGSPRRDGGEEIDARFRVVRRDVGSLRHAFGLDDYQVSGRLSGEFHLTGAYRRPIGFGAMTIEDAVAYGEPFQQGTATLRFDGAGVRLDAITIAKGRGAITGAAFVGWDSSYSFNGGGQRILVGDIRAFTYPAAAPSGVIEFSANGSGTFDMPRYDVRFRVNDFSVAAEPVGQVTGTVAVRGKALTGQIDAASPNLAVTGTGRIALDPDGESELTFRFHDSSLDPYVRLFVPKLSPFMTAAASGSIRITGQLADVNHLLVDGTVDLLDVRLFDSGDPERSRPLLVRNGAPIRLALDQRVVRFDDFQLVGEDTRLRVAGTLGLQDQRIALKATGDANLGILQALFRNVRASGRAGLTAAVDGPLRDPVFSGSATIVGGRIRHFSLPNALDAINGTIHFDPRAIRLDDVAATMGGGRMQFGGRIALEGFTPGDLNVSVRGEDVRLRYPEGVRSTVDGNLTLRGTAQALALGGSVVVKSATWNRRIDPTGGLFDFGGRAPGESGGSAGPPVPLRFDVEVRVPSTLRIENKLARLVASANLQLRGTYDRPQVIGRADVDRGEVTFEGRRYLVTKAAIEFTNPARIEPFFDVEAETRVRVPGQTYRVTVRLAGTSERLQPTLESDPPLPAADVLALLFSDVRRTQAGGAIGPGDVELRALQNPTQRQTDILWTRATRGLANSVSSEVGRVVEQTFGVDTFQLTPTLIDPYSQTTTTRVNPSARVTIGKRISDRVYLTFSRSLASAINDQIFLLEYDESDRLSWILSRNEDQTYAIEVRVRHAF